MLNPPPPEVIDWLDRQGWPSVAAHWQVLTGGQTNHLWRVQQPSGSLVVKLFCARGDNPLFPNSAANEAQMLRYLSPRGLAPSLLAEGRITKGSATGAVLVYPHQPGQIWGNTHSDRLVQVAAGLAELHQLPAPPGLRPLPGGSVALADQTEAILSQLPQAQAEALRALRPKIAIEASQRSCLLHGDPVPGNLILNADHLMMIDWQCPAVGDPVEDLAIFLSPAMQQVYRGTVLSTAEQQRFLAGYGDPETLDRLTALSPWYHWRMAAYCAWKQAQGNPAYATGYNLECAALLTRGE